MPKKNNQARALDFARLAAADPSLNARGRAALAGLQDAAEKLRMVFGAALAADYLEASASAFRKMAKSPKRWRSLGARGRPRGATDPDLDSDLYALWRATLKLQAGEGKEHNVSTLARWLAANPPNDIHLDWQSWRRRSLRGIDRYGADLATWAEADEITADAKAQRNDNALAPVRQVSVQPGDYMSQHLEEDGE
jgi:hypothetical protein